MNKDANVGTLLGREQTEGKVCFDGIVARMFGENDQAQQESLCLILQAKGSYEIFCKAT